MATKAAEKVQSVRLTENMRREIAHDLLKHKLGKREAAHAANEYKVAQRIYQHAFSAADRKKMDALPAGWLPTASYLRIKIGDDWRNFHFGAPTNGTYRETRRITQQLDDSRCLPIEVRSEIGVVVREYLSEGDAIKAERVELEAKAKGVLANVSTTSRLAEVWPEVIPFIPKHVPRLLPVVRREELNAAFGLRAA